MSNLDFRLADIIEGRFESIILDNEFGSTEEGHDGTFSDTSITNHDNSLFVLMVDWDRFDTGVNEEFEFIEIDGIGVFIHLIFKIYEFLVMFKPKFVCLIAS